MTRLPMVAHVTCVPKVVLPLKIQVFRSSRVLLDPALLMDIQILAVAKCIFYCLWLVSQIFLDKRHLLITLALVLFQLNHLSTFTCCLFPTTTSITKPDVFLRNPSSSKYVSALKKVGCRSFLLEGFDYTDLFISAFLEPHFLPFKAEHHQRVNSKRHKQETVVAPLQAYVENKL